MSAMMRSQQVFAGRDDDDGSFGRCRRQDASQGCTSAAAVTACVFIKQEAKKEPLAEDGDSDSMSPDASRMMQPVIWLQRIDETMDQDGHARLLWRCHVCAQRFQHHRQLMEHVGHAHVAVSGLRQDDDRGPTLVVSDVPLSDVKQDTSAAGSSNGIHMAYAEEIPYPEPQLLADDADCLAAAESPFNYGAAAAAVAAEHGSPLAPTMPTPEDEGTEELMQALASDSTAAAAESPSSHGSHHHERLTMDALFESLAADTDADDDLVNLSSDDDVEVLHETRGSSHAPPAKTSGVAVKKSKKNKSKSKCKTMNWTNNNRKPSGQAVTADKRRDTCGQCGQVFAADHQTVKHLRQVHSKYSQEDEEKSMADFLMIRQQHKDAGNKCAPDQLLTCPDCGVSVRCDSLLHHLLIHLPFDRRPFPCDQCSQSLVSGNQLKKHRRLHAMKQLGSRSKNPKNDESADEVDDGDQVTAEAVAPCLRCRQEFVDQQEMTKHMNQIHSCFRYKDAQPIVQKMTKKLVKEAIQAAKAGKQMDLKKNPKNEGRGKKARSDVVCKGCRRIFQNNRHKITDNKCCKALSRHVVRFHLPKHKRPFPCDRCQLQFGAAYDLSSHRFSEHPV